MNISLKGKKILITGGTSTLGAAFVQQAVKAGAQVYFTFYQDHVKAVELKACGAKGFQVNLASLEEIKKLKELILKETKALDGLILNAATVKDHTLQNMTEAEWDHVINVNLTSVYRVTKMFLRFFLKNERSKILSIVSQLGLRGGYGVANYAAAKGGLIAFTKSLAQEVGKRKILVNALNPGFMMSKMTKGAPNLKVRNEAKSVLGEMQDPQEVADFMVYLMSDYVKHVSGQTFHFESRII